MPVAETTATAVVAFVATNIDDIVVLSVLFARRDEHFHTRHIVTGQYLGYEALRDHVAFYPGRVDVAWMGDERVQAQASDFYGGWITADLIGPFKGPPETLGW